ncbi:hypothetical protein SAMN02910456_01338 [Ruminococcaceae bacterium YRB3002]|nr:hypothetical protein SAMN02910456_01338 [Ruminococcaceae bacterium YRB3002]
MNRLSFATPVYVVSLIFGILSLCLASASSQATLYGATETYYSPLVTSLLGPVSLLLYITALVLLYLRRGILSAAAGLLGCGAELYCLLTKTSDVEQKLEGRGYVFTEVHTEYGFYMSCLAMFCVFVFAMLVIAEEQDR